MYNDDYDGTKKFFLEIKKKKILTEDEQRELLIKAKTGDIVSRNMLVESNLRFVVQVARPYVSEKVQLIDLIQEGSKGLMDAIDHFDIAKETKFLTYAEYWIRDRIRKFLIKCEDKPFGVHELLGKARRFEELLTKQLGRKPTNKELACELGITVSQLNNAYNYMDKMSLNETFDDDDTEKGDLIPSDDEPFEKKLENNELREKLMEVFDECKLNTQEREILSFRFGLNNAPKMDFRKIAKIYNITHQRVQQIAERSIRKLRKSQKVYDLLDYLDKPSMAKANKSILMDKDKIDNSINEDVERFIYALQDDFLDLDLNITEDCYKLVSAFPNVNLNVLALFVECNLDLMAIKLLVLKYGLNDYNCLDIGSVGNKLGITTELASKLENLSLFKISKSTYYQNYLERKKLEK